MVLKLEYVPSVTQARPLRAATLQATPPVGGFEVPTPEVWTWGVWAKERRSIRKGGGVGIVKDSWDPSVVAWIPCLALYLLSCVTFKPCKQ